MTDSQSTPTRIEVSIERQVATIALNRPEVRNAIDDEMRGELVAALDALAADAAVRTVVVTGRARRSARAAIFPACNDACRRRPARSRSTAGNGSSVRIIW